MEYSATISWYPSDSKFAPDTEYTATIILTPKKGYTLKGVTTNQFKVAGATTTNPVDSGTITAKFPSTEPDYAGGLSPTLTELNPAREGTMILTLETAPSEGYMIYYRIESDNPSALVKETVLSTTSWTEITTTDGFEINISDGNYIQVAEVRNSDKKVTRWGKAGPANDGYTPQTPASGLTLTVEATSPPALDTVALTVSGGSAGSNYFYLVSPREGTPPIEGTTFNPASWYGFSLSAQPLTLNAASGTYIQVVETTTSNVVLRWGQLPIPTL